ncbi:MAG: hypothetical protein VKP62_12710 [Candidatus Sericytochromatia bacterium]|nr:hypothetical protein [Candidatus Sericytochromatia bacterium]
MFKTVLGHQTAEAAAFSLLQALRQVHETELAPVSPLRISYQGDVDPLTCGPSQRTGGDVGLVLEVTAERTQPARRLWVVGGHQQGTPCLHIQVEHAPRPWHLLFKAPTFGYAQSGGLRLQDRLLFPSSDPLYRERGQAALRLAKAWQVPLRDSWWQLGFWHHHDGRWSSDSPRRVLAMAWLQSNLQA